MNKSVLKKAIVRVIGVVGVATLPGSLQSASFDCAKAATPIEKMICESPPVSNLDEQLAAAYKVALEKAIDKDTLKQQQRAWLKEKRNPCKDSTCLFDVYQRRLTELSNLSANADVNLNSNRSGTVIKKAITFSLLDGEGYPLCKEFVDMLNKTQYTEIPACGPKILPEFNNFQEIEWVEIKNKSEIVKIIEERFSIQRALNPERQEQNYNINFDIKLIDENKLRMYLYKHEINNDDFLDIVYKKNIQPNYDVKKFGLCETINSYYVDDSKINLQSISQSTRDPYRSFNFSESNKLFIYGGNLYVNNYSGKTYHRINFEVYGVGNKKMCGILAK